MMGLRPFVASAAALLVMLLLPATAVSAISAASVLPGFGSQDASAAGGSGVLYDGGYTSADGGATWREVVGDAWTSVAVDPADARHVFIYRLSDGLSVSRDGGATWAPTDTTGCGIVPGADARIVEDPLAAGTLYLSSGAAGSIAVCRSDNSGASWSLAGSTSTTPLLVAAPPLAHSALVALRSVGGAVVLVRSSDGGSTWSATPTDLPAIVASDLPTYCGAGSSCRLYTNPQHPPWLVLRYPAGGRFTSADGGAHWTQQGLDPYTDFFQPERWMTVTGHPGVVIATAPDGLWRSTDGGLTYHRRLATDGRLVEDADGVLYLLEARGAIVSSDGGATWRWRGAEGRQPPFPDLSAPPSLSTDATGVVFAGTDAGVFRLDGSDRWTPASTRPIPSRGSIALGRHTLLAIRTVAGNRAALERSTDGGASWTFPTIPPCAGALATTFQQAAILTVVQGTQTVFLSITPCPGGGDVLRSTDAGATWRRSLVSNDSGSPLSFIPVPRSSTILVGPNRSDDSGREYTFHAQRALVQAKAVATAATRRAIYGVSTSSGSAELLAFSGDGRSSVGRLPSPAGLSGVPVVLVDPSRPFFAVAAVTLGDTRTSLPAAFETRDGGRSWTRLALEGTHAACVAASATLARGRVFVALGAAVDGDRQCAGVIASASL